MTTDKLAPSNYKLDCTDDQYARLKEKIRIAVDAIKAEMELDY